MAATFLGSITGTTLNINSLVSGTIEVGNALYGTGVLQGTFIVSGSGNIWTVNLSQTVVSDGSSLITSTAFNNNITPGRPPVLWSEVNEAFTKVNENFDILVATIGGGSGLTPIDFTSLDTDVTPTTDNLYELGDITHKWRSVFTGETTVADPLNGLWSGNAQIKGIGLTVNLPENSTIGGDPITGIGTSLIIDPEKTFFKEIQVNNDLSVVATTFGDTVNFLSSSGISLAVSSGADSITFSNTGILSVAAGSGITAATVSGVATITNAGVRSLQSTTALPSGRSTGAGINITASTGDNIRVTNTGVISISSGVGITVSLDAASGDVTITNSAPAVNAFTQVVVNGDTSNILAADAVSDVLNITSDATITLSKTVGTDTLNIAVNPVFDLRGSVFADDSSLLVDAVSGIVPAEVVSGTFTGNVVGNTTGSHDGDVSGSVFADDSTMLVDGVSGQIVGPINSFDGVNSITMDPINGVIIGGTSGAQIIGAAGAQVYIGGGTSGSTSGNILLGNGTNRVLFVSNTIDTDDSSALIFEPPVTFNTDVTFENDITVAERLTVKGSRVINLTELQSVVAASVDFADFQARIAALV